MFAGLCLRAGSCRIWRGSIWPETGSGDYDKTGDDSDLWTVPKEWIFRGARLVAPDGDGIYRLTATADPDGWFRETSERNNTTWVELRLTTSVDPPLVKVLRSGPIRSTS